MGIVDDERRAARVELRAAVTKKAAAQAEIVAGIRRCREAVIPVTEIALIIGVTRETVYRWAGHDVRAASKSA